MKPATGLLAIVLTSAMAMHAFADGAESQTLETVDHGHPGANYQPFDAAGSAPRVPLPSTVARPAATLRTGPAASAASNGPSRGNPAHAPGPDRSIERRKAAPVRTAGSAAGDAADTPYLPGMKITGPAVVLDGHSLAINGHAVRLHGVEAPGLGQTCMSASRTTWPCGTKARDRLEKIAGGEQVVCTVIQQAGDGAAALCAVRGIADIGTFLVTEGLAVPNGHAGGKYAAAAGTARAAGAGLWGGRFEAPWAWRLRNQ